MTCIFCNIYEKNKNSIIYETDKCFVLLDRFPMSKGHLLIVPKIHHSYLHEYNYEDISDILKVIHCIIKKLKLEKYNILQNNGNFQSVMHVHFHIIPYENDQKRLKIDWKTINVDEKEYSNEIIIHKNLLEN